MLALLACAIPPNGAAPSLRDAAAVGIAAGPRVAVAADWWRAFGDPQLDALVAAALADSPNLAAALARVRLARAAIGEARAGLLPQAAVDGNVQRQRLSENYIIPPPYGGSTQWVGNIQASLGWNLDLFGRQAAIVAQARSTTAAAALDGAAARLSISAAVAQVYVDYVRAGMLVAIADRFVASRGESLKLARSRIRNGLASEFDARAAETLLAQARQAAVIAAGDRELATHALAALAGRGADFYATIRPPVLDPKRVLPLPRAIPADLLGRRPDVLAARAQVEAASAGRRTARAAYYPNINLTALAGVQALGLGNLFSIGSATYGGGAAFSLPLFTGGRLAADFAGATARRDIAVAEYDATVLRAVQEAADALAQVRTTAEAAVAQAAVVSGLEATVRLDRSRVASGLGSRLDELASADRLLAAEQTAAGIAADGANARIRLLAALGGGFDITQLPDAKATR